MALALFLIDLESSRSLAQQRVFRDRLNPIDVYTLPGHKYLYRPKFPLIFLRIYLLIIESTH